MLLNAGLSFIGCSSEKNPTSEPDAGNLDQTDEQASPLSDAAWAKSILEQSAKWDAVTPEPVLANPAAFLDCASPFPPTDEPPSPHNPQRGYDAGIFGTESGPNAILTNQFVVNQTARPHFRLIPVDSWQSKLDVVYPVGSIIVKEKYDDIQESNKRGRTNAIAVMTKRKPGYDPGHGDWEYAYIDLDTEQKIKTITRGKISNCIDCHSNRSASDYVFRDYLITR